jgi:Ca2+/Na+ antiporter
MKAIFKNKTKYSNETYKNFLEFHQNKYGINYDFTTIVMILLITFCIIANFKYSNFGTGILFILVLIIFIFYRFFYPVKKVKKEIDSDKFKNEREFIFKFYDKYFTINQGKKYTKIRYWQLHKAFENNNFFYLYINKDHAFLLDKNGFYAGDSSAFLRFIKKKILFKI